MVDQKQEDHRQRYDQDVDAFAVKVISELALSFNDNNGNMPKLAASTDYDSLLKMKDEFDTYCDLLWNNGPSEEQTVATHAFLSHGFANKLTAAELLEQVKDSQLMKGFGPFILAQSGLLAKHSTDIVQLYW